jgi:hypothetical protein
MGLIYKAVNGQTMLKGWRARTEWYLEVEGDERKDKGLQVLHKVVKDSKSFGIV